MCGLLSTHLQVFPQCGTDSVVSNVLRGTRGNPLDLSVQFSARSRIRGRAAPPSSVFWPVRFELWTGLRLTRGSRSGSRLQMVRPVTVGQDARRGRDHGLDTGERG